VEILHLKHRHVLFSGLVAFVEGDEDLVEQLRGDFLVFQVGHYGVNMVVFLPIIFEQSFLQGCAIFCSNFLSVLVKKLLSHIFFELSDFGRENHWLI